MTWPESAGKYATAADLPPELFEIIIRNVPGRYDDHKDVAPILCKCALVALQWARFARAIFWGDIVKCRELKSSRDARILVETTLRGCPRLTPLIDLLTEIRAGPNVDDEQSWLYMLASIPSIRTKLKHAMLYGGDDPKSFGWRFLRMPHRGTPFGTAGFPPLTHLTALVLFRIHFGQFSELVMLLRHFASPDHISISGVTWDKTDVPMPWPPRSVYSKRSTGIRRMDVHGCTDNTLVAMAAHALDARLPVQTLPGHEWLQVQQLSQVLHANQLNPLYTYPVGVPIPFERLGRLLIACSQPVPSSEPQVIGALLLLTHRDDDQHQVTTLHDFLLSVIHFSGLRAVGVAYNGDHNKLLSLLAEVSASVPQLPSDIIFRLICPRDHTALEPQGWFELEWLTKEATGQVWKCDKGGDKEHSHSAEDCGHVVFARAMSSAVEEHIRNHRFTAYAETLAVV
ncbi:hypothetical protein BDW22DRAFT_623033 [Trametopsis cervina]|nr:hypothetical protein BDW22DRAFT_623033 [Trametopsis cervina]